jgi:hypothetical protein
MTNKSIKTYKIFSVMRTLKDENSQNLEKNEHILSGRYYNPGDIFENKSGERFTTKLRTK